MVPRILTISKSPLQVRTSIGRLSTCRRPWRLLLRLLWPLPWHFRLEARPTVAELERDGGMLQDSQQPGIMQLRRIPLFRMRDTPLRSLYRLYEDLCSAELIMMGYECDYFFFHNEHSWRLCQMPDPKEPDPITYAILASMVEALVDAFNWRLELGLRRDKSMDESEHRHTNFNREEAPSWTAAVPPLPETLHLDKVETGTLDASFLKRNIRAPKGYLYTV
ncbi:hypothetical protein AYO20_05608 [Fonsecaea nubica]|uniref:Uncharacterized protein n=1 Tax=Fonsecaea nubica TaxID=856822 RepID=A0A178D1U8_9EURO|nr:hypothetical protein AYO20_05608 [Fonsecaea nubica]OAL35131.1 hypothetical protein AYO20_05608 [Fonsecaea nubica]